MDELLKNSGFHYISSCSCGGVQQRKYYNPQFPLYKIKILPGKQKFIALKNNIRIADGGQEELKIVINNFKEYGQATI